VAKRGTIPKIDETPPTGPITDAPDPIAVRVRVNWKFGGPMVIENAWAMAWTRTEVYIYYRTPTMDTGQLVWLRRDQVRRRYNRVRRSR
jgi:hypothetical protein